MAALVALTRYLAARDPRLVDYLLSSLTHAQESDLAEEDLSVLKTLISAVGGPSPPDGARCRLNPILGTADAAKPA